MTSSCVLDLRNWHKVTRLRVEAGRERRLARVG